MMRILLALLFSFLAGTLALAAPPRDWADVATQTASGSYRIGDPAAKVKLIEYISYTCPHCRHFTEESAATLKGGMVRSGSTSIEIRNQIHDKLDLAATLLARCIGPATFPRFHETLYAKQEEWVPRGVDYDSTNAARDRLYSPEAQLRATADGSGLSDLARASGMPAATLDRCFTDPAIRDRTLKASAAIDPAIRGTPAFQINGGPPQFVTWAALEPMLRAAGAK